MKIIDIHNHLQFSDYDDHREKIILECQHNEQGNIVVGTNFETSQSAVELAISHENMWATVGLHPTENTKFEVGEYQNLIQNNQNIVVAVGECGLDYFRAPKDDVYQLQSGNFKAQIELAVKYNVPLMLHGRPSKGSMDAYQDMIDILKAYRNNLPENPGNAHFFVGDLSIARQLLEMNFTLSFDGPITFARDYDEVIQYVPGDMIHAETDAPYAAPVPHRGQQNSPLYVSHVIDSLIAIRDEKDPDFFRQKLVSNAKRVFCLD